MGLLKKSDQARWDARHKRQARWQKPMNTLHDRIYAYMNMIFVDHGIFRMLYLNLHHVTPRFWRAAQPTPAQIAQLAGKGLKTIINLRGGREHGSWPLEVEACAKAGIALCEITLRSREAPSVEAILELKTLFETIEYPAMIHCKSGADRAGLASALYLLLMVQAPVDVAQQQLSTRYGHFKGSKTGILDEFLEAYAQAQATTGIAFLEWVQTAYNPAAITASFTPNMLGWLMGDALLRRE